MVEEEHLDELENEMGIGELEEDMSMDQLAKLIGKSGFAGMRLEDLGDLDMTGEDESALNEELQALGEMFGGGGMMGGENVDVSRSSVQFVTGNDVKLSQSASLNVAAEAASLQASAAALLRAEEVTLDRSAVSVLVANSVTARNSVAGVVIARTVNGEVRSLLDWRSALMFGLGLSIGFSVVRMVRNAFRLLGGLH